MKVYFLLGVIAIASLIVYTPVNGSPVGSKEAEDAFFGQAVECLEAVKTYVMENEWIYTTDDEKVKSFLTTVHPSIDCRAILSDERGNQLDEDQKAFVNDLVTAIKAHIVHE